MLQLRTVISHPLFVVGLLVKLAMVCLLMPAIELRWFVPFVQGTLLDPSIDPWTTHLAAGGDPMAFPYGPVMLLALLPGVALTTAVALVADLPLLSSGVIGLGLGLLLADFAALLVLLRLSRSPAPPVLALYWLSPIVLYVCYWLGQLDIVPVLLLLTSLLLLRDLKLVLSGAVLGVAVAAKFSMLLAVPFVAVYLLRNNRLRRFAAPHLGALAGTLLVLQGPLLLSGGARQMVFGTPEAQKVYQAALSIGDLNVYLLPLVYLLTVYAAWRVRRMSFGLLLSLLGLGFFLVILLTPASPGWFLWLVPFLVLHQVVGRGGAILVTSVFTAVYLSFQILYAEGAAIPLLGLDFSQPLALRLGLFDTHLGSLWLTLLTATGLVVVATMVRQGVQRNDYFRLSRRPLLLGIAGDSGVGKDTLALALEGLFGKPSVARLSGDDYHLWDRAQPMWRALTHLNPRANDLERFNADVLALADGRTIRLRHYDHGSGRYLRPMVMRQNDVVIVSGLHALHPPQLRERYDVRVFLDMDEDLRRAFKLQRDVGVRGHSPQQVLQAIEQRVPDARKFIDPQAGDADLVLGLAPARAGEISADSLEDMPLRLHASLRHCLYLNDLLRALIGLCGLHVDYAVQAGGAAVELTIEGDVTADDLALAARLFLSHLEELLDVQPRFEDGMTGVMQLIILAQSAQALRERLA